uniref:Translocase of outer mitochondrial membrane 40 homolog (yeast) n=1 Tax=Hucho hucho TaxID=62062 RepID=A0A4W5PQL0_9TELE
MGSVLAASSPTPPPAPGSGVVQGAPGLVSVPPGFSMPSVPPPSVPGQPAGETGSPLSNPGTYEECHRKCKEVFPIQMEGVRLVVNKGLSNHFQVSHTVTLSTLAESGYRFGATYVGTQQTGPAESFPVMVGDMDNSGSLNAQVIHQLTSAVRSKIAIQTQQHKFVNWQCDLEYRGDDFTSAVTLGNPDVLLGSGRIVFSSKTSLVVHDAAKRPISPTSTFVWKPSLTAIMFLLPSLLITRYDGLCKQSERAGYYSDMSPLFLCSTVTSMMTVMKMLLSSGIIVAHYLQSISPTLALGGELVYHRRPGEEGAVTSLMGRYTGNNYVATFTLGGAGAHATYYHRANDQLQLGVEFEGSMRTQETAVSFGYQLDLPKANLLFKGSVDSNWVVGAVLEKKLPPLPLSLALGAFLNQKKNKFQCGFNVTVG